MSFFKSLAKRTGRDPKPTVEAMLRSELDRQFARDFRKSRVRWEFDFSFLRWAPLAAVLLLVTYGGSRLGELTPRSPSLESAPMAALANPDTEIIFERDGIEFYDELEDWMLTASDDEWNEVLTDEKDS